MPVDNKNMFPETPQCRQAILYVFWPINHMVLAIFPPSEDHILAPFCDTGPVVTDVSWS
jgi:hypothetical protein